MNVQNSSGQSSCSIKPTKRCPRQTPRVGLRTLEGGARTFSRIITTGDGLDISAARDVPSPEGTGRIRVSSVDVLGKTGARASPSAEVLTVLLGKRTVGESFD